MRNSDFMLYNIRSYITSGQRPTKLKRQQLSKGRADIKKLTSANEVCKMLQHV